jgi:hypothetical protein
MTPENTIKTHPSQGFRVLKLEWGKVRVLVPLSFFVTESIRAKTAYKGCFGFRNISCGKLHKLLNLLLSHALNKQLFLP